MNEVEEIKNRLNIAEIISGYIELNKAGANFKARCPFHNEKTPSFFVSPEKQIWHCFGCEEGGDVFTFVQKMEGIEFREALKILAEKAGVKLKPRDPRLESQRNRLIEICDWTARFFHQALLRSQQGQIARDYLASRKVDQKSILDFSLGYSPDSWDLTSKFLKKKGYQAEEIVQAGLATKNAQGEFYDRFRARLMFPIRNVHGQIVGFGARVLDEARDPLGKYINSPQTLIYDKSNLLYGLDKAKEAIKKQDLCIAVEGYLDVIASHAVAIRNVVSVSGTALTPRQLNLIKRYTKNLALCFDADSAGAQASKRGIENAVASGLSVRIIVLPRGEDPDSLIQKDPRFWQKAIQKSQSIIDFYFDLALQTHDPEKLAGKKSIATELLPLIKKIPDDIEQAYYLQELAQKLSTEEMVLRKAMEKMGSSLQSEGQSESEEILPEETTVLPPEEILGRRILGLGLVYPQFLDQILKEVPLSTLPLYLQEIYKILKKYYNQDRDFNLADFRHKIESLNPSYVAKMDVAVLDIEKDFEEEGDLVAAELASELKRLKKIYLQKELKELAANIKEAESRGDKAILKELTQEFSALSREMAHL